MITAPIKFLIARCDERGYSFEDAKACIVSQNGDIVTVDETHPAYPRLIGPVEPYEAWLARTKTAVANNLAMVTSGPGTELKKLLAKVGITATPTCSCNARARAMDENEAREPGWCEAHLDEIVGWLREEAEKRKLPFLDMAGRVLVRRAIKNARKEAAARAERPPHQDRR